jgi:beta-lactam-binding protein with PASTA domain
VGRHVRFANATGLCKVPNVTVKTLPAAKRAIGRANCRVGTIRRDYSKTVKGAA